MSRKIAKEVLRIERDALTSLMGRIGPDFDHIIDVIRDTKGRIIVTGMGKPGFIAQKISATLSSTGTPSLYLHPAEALHGDLGRVTKDDLILALSNSGETEEIIKFLPILKKIRLSLRPMCRLIAKAVLSINLLLVATGMTSRKF